jgi:5-methylcytosine-specific restriction endonuclease McrA
MAKALRQCLREPISEIELAAQRLNDAVSAHLQGEHDVAEALLRLADDKIVGEWLDSVWGKTSEFNRRSRVLDCPPVLPSGQRLQPRSPTAETKRLIHERDGRYCRYCKIPVVRAEVRRAIRKQHPGAVQWEGTNATQHAAFQCMWAQYDHVIPHARGGCSNLENVYLTCAACNYGRMHYLLEEQDLMHPGLHAPRRGDWDGLERFLAQSPH